MNFLILTTAKYRKFLVSTGSLYIGQVPVVVLLLVSLVACGNLQDMGADTIGSGADSSAQPTQSGTAMPSQQDEEPTDSGCAYCVDFDGVAEEYEANPIRAEGKYVDEWVRIRGGIGTLNELENSKAAVRIISVSLDNGASFQITDTIRRDNGDERFYEWRNWLLTKDIGDVIEVECRVTGLASRQRNPDLTPGTPLISDCNYVVDGHVVGTPTPMPTSTTLPEPTPTDTPTSTPRPCQAVELGVELQRLVIDCPANKVIAWREAKNGESDNWASFFWFPNDDSTPVRWGQGTATWARTTQLVKNRWGRPAAREVWEAPPGAAASIISSWRNGAKRMAVSFEGGGVLMFNREYRP